MVQLFPRDLICPRLGCIPVIFLPNIKYPFDDIIDYSSISVSVDQHLIMNDLLDIVQHLKGISAEEIEHLQDNIYNVALSLQYSEVGSEAEKLGDDAFALAMREALSKVRGKIGVEHQEL